MGCGPASDNKHDQPSKEHLTLNRIYERLQLIGSGTFGKVYLCRNNLNGLEYALKVVELTASNREGAARQVQSLKGQIRVLRKLNHPNVVKYFSFDVSEDTKEVEIVLEYAKNGSLKSYIGEVGPLPQQEVSAKIAQILQGLSYLHQQNIVHRDLKCANILVMEDGTLKITDFGTAKHIQGTSKQDIAAQCSSLKGTPYYMAPQILRRNGHNTAADIWSLGCVVIEMLTARAPWASLTSDFKEIIGYIVNGIHPPFPKLISSDCQSFLSACFDTVPSQRPTSHELLQHPWIEPKQRTPTSDYNQKYSLSKTNDDIEEIQGQDSSRRQKRNKKQRMIKEIDNYIVERIKQKPKKRQGKGQSAKPKRQKTANLLFSQQQLVHPEEIQVLDYYKPITRQLFQDQQKPRNHDTTPHFKLPEKLIVDRDQAEKQQEMGDEEGLDGIDPLEVRKRSAFQIMGTREGAIDTMISRGERVMFLQQQRLLQEQKQKQRYKWQKQLKQGANYLKKQINSRYPS